MKLKHFTFKITLLMLINCSTHLTAISSNMSHQTLSTSPLFYKMIDYGQRKNCFEIEPVFSSMYDAQHTISNLTPSGKQTLIFDQQGQGDINPVWLNLMSNNSLADYFSTVTLTPKLTQSGALLHWYDQFDTMFVEIKTALVQCKTEIEIAEVGGGNGLNPGVLNAQQAFTQSDWNYGKIGQSNHVVGLDDIEIRLGRVSQATSNNSDYDLFISGYGLIQAPTGSGTKAEWLFEPQVGTNHWGLGFGFEALVSGDDDLKFMIAGNYRYLIPAWETRSFDLLGNGSWSRYLSVQETYGLPKAPATLGLPGINYFTQQAYINGRSELNLYARLQKQFKSSSFELSYNFLCIQQETIGAIQNINPGYGIYALTGPAGGAGGVTTASNAMINQSNPVLDSNQSPQTISNANFDKTSACAQTIATNNLTARLEIKNNNLIYGFGASIESALSASAISTWSVWAQFGFIFDTVSTHHDDFDDTNFYDYSIIDDYTKSYESKINNNAIELDTIQENNIDNTLTEIETTPEIVAFDNEIDDDSGFELFEDNQYSDEDDGLDFDFVEIPEDDDDFNENTKEQMQDVMIQGQNCWPSNGLSPSKWDAHMESLIAE